MSTGNPTEIVRDIPDWPGCRVSNLGNVSCCLKRGRGGGLTDTWRPLKACLNKVTGYLSVHLHNRGHTKIRTVHSLVLEAFIGPRPVGAYECRHLNGDKTDNRLENLAWGTCSENNHDKVQHGTSNRGERQGLSRLTEELVREIRHLKGIVGAPSLAARFGVARQTINDVMARRTWNHIKE